MSRRQGGDTHEGASLGTTSLPVHPSPNAASLAARPWVDRLALVGFLSACIAAAALLLHLGRGLTFFYDEWDWIFDRRSGSGDAFLRNHNGHLHLLPITAYRILFATVGLQTYLPYRLAVIAVHLACAGAVFVYCRRRVAPPAALAVSVVVLFLGAAWQNLLWPFQIGFLGSVLFGVLALLILDGHTGWRDWLLTLAILLAIVSSGIGIPVLLAVAAELAIRREWRRLVRIVGPPVVAYGLWALGYGASQVHQSNISRTPRYVFDAAAGAAAGLGNVSMSTGRMLVVGLTLAVVAFVAVHRRLSPRVVALVVAGGSYWGLTALSRAGAGEPAASRYVYFGGVVLLLLIVELVRRWGSSTAVNMAAVLIAGSLAWSNLVVLRAGAAGHREVSSFVRAELSAVELAGARTPADFRPDEGRMPQVTAGAYLAAVQALGSPADTLASLRRRPAPERASADDVLIRALGRTDEQALGCRLIEHGGTYELQVPRNGVVIAAGAAPVTVGLRRFGPDYTVAEPVASGRSVRLRLTEDAAPEPWLARLVAGAPFEVCSPNG